MCATFDDYINESLNPLRHLAYEYLSSSSSGSSSSSSSSSGAWARIAG